MQKKSELRVLGMMSGTSLDGLDLVLSRFSSDNNIISWKIDAAATVAYPASWEDRINSIFHGTAAELARLNTELGTWMGEQAATFLKEHGTADLISSHGHTLFHDPASGYTYQAGSGAPIAVITGIPVVSDLRSMDVAAKGQGAPLVPIGDELLFPQYAACLNLGGFSNISFDRNGVRKAFDICPLNFLLNRVANSLGYAYDDEGRIARSGTLIPELLQKLDELPFYGFEGPKSLGREQVEALYKPLMDEYLYRPQDLLATLCQHMAGQMLRVISNAVNPGAEVLLSGGGALNKYLVELMSKGTTARLVVADEQLLQYKEGLIFALLGWLRIQNRPNALQSVTGAKIPTTGGALYGDFSALVQALG